MRNCYILTPNEDPVLDISADAAELLDRGFAAPEEQLLVTQAFDEWIDNVFNHPVGQSKWHWNDDTNEIESTVAIRHLTQLFTTAQRVLSRFSNAQVGQGLWYLACGACSNYMWPLVQNGMPWESRRNCIRAISSLFDQLFAERCLDRLSHLDECDADVLNEVCYMWWDLFPTWGSPADPRCRERDVEVLRVMSGALSSDSVACQESALHGLGHWYEHYPESVEQAVRQYLHREKDLRPELRQYALDACQGNVS
jgi:hypothetical protein